MFEQCSLLAANIGNLSGTHKENLLWNAMSCLMYNCSVILEHQDVSVGSKVAFIKQNVNCDEPRAELHSHHFKDFLIN